MLNNQKINRRDFGVKLSQSALAFALMLRGSQLLATPAKNSSKTSSILVLGAGLSGLYTAWLLERQGFNVTILEARERVGGRVHTLDDLPGKPESGGQSFNEQYQRLLKLAEALNLSTKPKENLHRRQLLSVNQELVLSENWESSSANNLSATEKSIIPAALISNYLRPHNPLTGSTDWVSPEYYHLDISLAQYLRNQGASEAALRLMNIYPFAMNDLNSASALWGLRNDQRAQHRSSNTMIQPWGRIHFAGEHTAISDPGMESALQSAERVVQKIISF